jgi:hypothetical protein
MSWNRISDIGAPVSRPVWVRTAENDAPVVAFLGADGAWYAGGALVQNSTNILAATPIEWCEPDGDQSL